MACPMSEIQPDMLGGKAVPGSRLRRGRRSGPPVVRDGWADRPGTGPEGETCGSCTYCEAFHYAKRYHKCAARDGRHWQGGRATDIRPLNPACSKWAPSVNRTNQPKGPTHESDRNAVPTSQPEAPRSGRGTGGDQPLRGDHCERGGVPVADLPAKQAATRSQRLNRANPEGLQRAFEF